MKYDNSKHGKTIRLTNRFDEELKYEKCPVCLNIGRTFIDYGDRFGCLDCGCIFLSKSFRIDIKSRQKGILQSQSGYVCEVCKKVFEKRIALTGHMRGVCGRFTDESGSD